MEHAEFVGGAHLRFERSLHQRPRRIEHHRFLYVESGSGELSVGGRKLALEGPMFLLLAPGMREIRYDDSGPIAYRYVEFRCEGRWMTAPWVICPASSPHLQTLICLVGSILHGRGEGARPLIAAAVGLMRGESVTSGPEALADERIRRALDHAERHLNRPVRVGELASVAGLSEPQFRRLFRANLGIPPKEYLLRSRMDYARRILESEGLRVGEVADALQFESVYQFSKQFKKIHGHSPSMAPEKD